MQRRLFVTSIACAGLSGCTSPAGESTTDSDGDGVPDKHDYAPRDPSVQSRSDINTPTATPARTDARTTSETPTPTPSPTPTPTSTPTDTPTATPTPQPTNVITANYAPIENFAVAYFKSYSLEQATVEFVGKEVNKSIVDSKQKLAIGAASYKGTRLYDTGHSQPFTVSRRTNTRSLDFDLSDVPTDTPFLLFASLIPTDTTLEQASSEDVEYLCETDRLSLSNGQLTKNTPSAEKDTLREDGYERVSGEGMYAISVTGEVSFDIAVFKHAYVSYASEPTLSTPEAVIRQSVRDGLGPAFASIIHDAAEAAGYRTPREKVNYAVKAIQAFPYVPDDVDNSYDDYNKYTVETLVEAGGDCEDTCILLASALLSEPFRYGCALIYLPYDQPTHVGVGVKGDDSVRGTYFTVDGDRYFYTETTGEGWEIGDLPQEYANMSADVRLP